MNDKTMRRLSLGTRLYISILSLFIIMVAISIFVQRYAEGNYRKAVIDVRLQSYNARIMEVVGRLDSINDDVLNAYIEDHFLDDLRLTIIDEQGHVTFDNINEDYASMNNHLDRKEVKKALATGHGTVTERASSSTSQEYFYSANYYPEHKLIIRSALPYDDDLVLQLSPGNVYIWLIVSLLLLLMAVLRFFVSRMVSRLEHQKEIERLQVRRELTQNIAHELKTPITSILAYLDTLVSQGEIDEEVKQRFLQNSYKQAQLLASLVRDISVINRLEYRPDYYQVEEVDVHEVIVRVLADVAIHLDEHRMTCNNNVPTGTLIEGNRNLLYGIFRNLTDNAILYAGPDTTIDIAVAEKTQYYLFTFKDNGSGVGQEHLNFLFDRFYRVDKGRERAMGSTGLGLSVVKNAVQFHGGAIHARNASKGGLKFTFTLAKKHYPASVPSSTK